MERNTQNAVAVSAQSARNGRIAGRGSDSPAALAVRYASCDATSTNASVAKRARRRSRRYSTKSTGARRLFSA